MVWGVTPTGFRKKVFTDIWEDIKAQVRAVPGLSRINLAREKFLGAVVAIAALAIAEGWDVLQELYTSGDVDSAEGRALDNAVALVGKYRRPATATNVVATVNLDVGTYAAGSLVASPFGRPEYQFTNRDAITRAGSTGNETAVFVCTTTGAIPVPTATLTVRAVSVPGWNSVTNADDGVQGVEIESDAELRARRLIFSDRDTLANDSRVQRLFIFDNNTDATVDGRPPHSFEAVVYDGTDDGSVMPSADIARLIFLSKPAGIATVGDITEVVTDSNGTDHTIKFSRPTTLRIYLKVTVVEGPGWDDTAGPLAIQQVLADYADAAYTCGSTVLRSFLFGPVSSVAGVADITNIQLGLASNPSGTANLTTTAKQIPRIATGDIIVVHA